jgi:hypothetical protein
VSITLSSNQGTVLPIPPLAQSSSLCASFVQLVESLQTNPVRSIHYPQGWDDFTEELSVVRSTGSLFHKFFKDLKLSVPSMIKFVIRCGMQDLK